MIQTPTEKFLEQLHASNDAVNEIDQDIIRILNNQPGDYIYVPKIFMTHLVGAMKTQNSNMVKISEWCLNIKDVLEKALEEKSE